jgi:hypothetical protein
MFLQILSRLAALCLSYPGSGSFTSIAAIDGLPENTYIFLLVTTILSALVLLLLRKTQDVESSLPTGQCSYPPPGGIGCPLVVRMLHGTGCQPSRSHPTSPSSSGPSSIPSDECLAQIPRPADPMPCSASSSPPPPPPPPRTFSPPQSTFFPIWVLWLTILLTYVGWTLVMMRVLPRCFERLRSKARRVFIWVIPKVRRTPVLWL